MTAYYNEHDPFAAAWLRELIKDNLIAPGEVDERSIIEVKGDDLRGYTQCHFFAGIGGWSLSLRRAGWTDDRPVWTGSCPCQPFSGAGKRKGVSDERHLWPEFYQLIASCRPATVFGEQVAGPDGLEWAENVSADFGRSGYEVGIFVLPAYTFQCPQKRERIYFAADTSLTDARGRSADVRWNRGLPTMEASAWPPPPWQQGNANLGIVDDGLPGTLVKSCLRGFGNAIVPQVAANFIQAYSASRPHLKSENHNG